jgi:hypothetical protein
VDARGTADEAVGRAKQRLVGNRVGTIVVDSVFHYGAVDIDPRHLVVWVLLSGADDEQLPKWFFGRGVDAEQSQADRLGPELESALMEMQAVVRHELEAVGWPSADRARVGFDSSHRVDAGGGWHYFK